MARVLVIHTGGTLGMIGTPLEPGTYAQAIAERVPELSALAELHTEIVCNLDSSDLGPAEWIEVARRIDAGRAHYDGFVVVHGTDTMAYTAGALAFALRNLDRPVVLTGAQRPLAALRTDARRNLQDAVELATRDVPEVGICFDGLLLRGCRAVKADARLYRAFDTPGLEPLARFGVDLAIGRHVRRPAGPFACDPRFDARVAVVHVTPGLATRHVEALLDTDLRGLVVAAYGVGTIPMRDQSIAPASTARRSAGVEVLVVTQHGGLVDLRMYRNGQALADLGATPGGKMHVEAAVPKLMHALAVYPERAERQAWLSGDAAGEQE
jgi:L-asparaginase